MTAQHNSIARQAVLQTQESVHELISKLQSHPEDDDDYKQMWDQLSTFGTALSDLSNLLPYTTLELNKASPRRARILPFNMH